MITLEKKEIYAFSMREELTRAKKAIELTQSGKKVAVISGGDPGIYGMAGVVLEIMQKQKLDLEIEIIPGVPAFCAASSLLGAALMNDFALISLSDLFTPLEIIKKRIISAIKGDFVIILYNPSSKSRKKQIKEIHSLLLEYKPPQTPLGIVWQAKRSGERMLITTLEKMPAHQINMSATIIIGNSSTYLFNKYLITPRGYKI
jgi:precorrin-3B C17-methyltransferase